MLTTGEQIRAARGALCWSREKLAREAGTSSQLVTYWEGRRDFSCEPSQGPGKFLRALEGAGIRFITHPAPGVCING